LRGGSGGGERNSSKGSYKGSNKHQFHKPNCAGILMVNVLGIKNLLRGLTVFKKVVGSLGKPGREGRAIAALSRPPREIFVKKICCHTNPDLTFRDRENHKLVSAPSARDNPNQRPE
jgi:hypothetical protein